MMKKLVQNTFGRVALFGANVVVGTVSVVVVLSYFALIGLAMFVAFLVPIWLLSELF